MKTGRTNNWMVWGIIILAVMNIATLLTVVYHRNQAVKEEIVRGNSQVQSERSSMRYSGRYFRDQLNLNNRQMDLFLAFNPVFRQNVRSINSDLARLRQQMMIEMKAQDCDLVKLNMLSDSIGILHADLKKLTYKYYMDIKNICDEQQQKKLEQMFVELFAGDDLMGQHGKGGPAGRGPGRRFNN